jgi:hypothetical protein
MSTKILNPKENPALQPAHGLWQQYRPKNAPYAFRAQTLAATQAWQAETRPALREDGQERDLPDDHHKDFAVELCRASFLVAAPHPFLDLIRRADSRLRRW